VTFAPGQTSATVPVTVNGSTAIHCYFGIQMLAPESGVVIVNNYGRANLLHPTDAAHDLVYAGTTEVMQTTTDSQTALFPVTSSPHTDTISCTVNTADGTAVASSGDYNPIVGGTVTLSPGQISATVPITIPIGPPNLPQRGFTVTLSGCSANVALADPTGAVTIIG